MGRNRGLKIVRSCLDIVLSQQYEFVYTAVSGHDLNRAKNHQSFECGETKKHYPKILDVFR